MRDSRNGRLYVVDRGDDVGQGDPGVRYGPAYLAICLRSTVERHGLASLAGGLPHDVEQYGSGQFDRDLAEAAGATLAAAGVLVIALRDLEDAARRQLESWAARGLRLLVLLDDVTAVADLGGVRFAGLALREQLDFAMLRETVERLLGGELVMPGEVARHLIATSTEPARADSGPVRLTPREQQTLMLLVDGLSNKQIATTMGISGHGVKRLVANVLAKLNCTNRTGAVARALREGIYDQCRHAA